MENIYKIMNQISMKMLETDSLEEVICYAGSLLGNLLLYFENSVSPTIASDREQMEMYMKYSVDHQNDAEQMSVDIPLHFLEISDTIARSKGAFLWEQGPVRRIICSIDYEHGSQIHLTLVENTRTFEDSDYQILEHTASVILMYLKQKKVDSFSDLNKTFFVRLLDQGNKISERELKNELELFGWSQTGNYSMVMIPLTDPYTAFHPSSLVMSLRLNLEPVCPAHGILYDRNLVFLLESQDVQQELIRKVLVQYLQGTRLKASVIWKINSLSETRHYYAQVRQLFLLGSSFMPESSIYSMDELYWQYISHTLERCGCLKDICSEKIAWLKEKEPRLYKALNIYTRFSCNIQKSAEHLQIHRNTLTKYLERCLQLTGLDPSDPMQLWRIRISIGILSYMDVQKLHF